MDDDARARLIGVAMVLVGLLQAGGGALSENWIFAGLGLTYALIGVFQFRAAG
jgi:hypothetical protein